MENFLWKNDLKKDEIYVNSDCIFYVSRNIGGKFTKGLLVNLKILEIDNNTIDFLTINKTEKSTLEIENIADIKIANRKNIYSDFYEKEAINMKSWMEVYENLDITEFQNYKRLYIFGGLHFPQGDIFRFSKQVGIFPNNSKQLKFRQNGIHIINILAIYKSHIEYNIPLFEFAYDCDEFSCDLLNLKKNPNNNYYLYHIYDMQQYNMKRLDSLNYHLLNKKQSLDKQKIYEFVFGYSVYKNGNRPSYVKYVNDIAERFSSKKIYIKNVLTGEDNSIDRDDYLKEIAHAKYTLILPSYDNDCFSAYRFIESIFYDCLPIVNQDCNISQFEKSFNVDISILKTEEIYSESKRLEVLDYLKNKLLVFKNNFYGDKE